MPNLPGRLVILSGPSGVGKTSIVKKLLAECSLPLVLSVSATTRQSRPGELDGIDYHFLTQAEFARRREAGEFLECCEVFGRGHWYGTLKQEVDTSLDQGKWVILEIDVEGAMAVLKQRSEALTIFIRPDSIAELERRLRGRGSETEDTLQERLDRARREISYADKYQFCLVNDTLDQTVDDICRILLSQDA